MIGRRFGRWVVLRVLRSVNHHGVVLARCDCGIEKSVLRQSLVAGLSESCGCQSRERKTQHGHSSTSTHAPSREYNSWNQMNQRCYNSNKDNFALYGGRGITVFADWRYPDGFTAFLSYLGERPDRTSLDRIDPNGNYEPGNVRWATFSEQTRNTRRRAAREVVMPA